VNRRATRNLQRLRTQAFRDRQERELVALERDYRAGQTPVFPGRITMALDLHGLQGPEVDRACLAEEPAVDQWEAGEAAPSWEQLVALAELTEMPVGFFFRELEQPALSRSIVCGRGGCQVVEVPPAPEPYFPPAPVVRLHSDTLF
jgi:transcriptional regulator with XRE-family HTH domain